MFNRFLNTHLIPEAKLILTWNLDQRISMTYKMRWLQHYQLWRYYSNLWRHILKGFYTWSRQISKFHTFWLSTILKLKAELVYQSTEIDTHFTRNIFYHKEKLKVADLCDTGHYVIVNYCDCKIILKICECKLFTTYVRTKFYISSIILLYFRQGGWKEIWNSPIPRLKIIHP